MVEKTSLFELELKLQDDTFEQLRTAAYCAGVCSAENILKIK